MAPETLADHAFDAIADDRSAVDAPRDRHAEARVALGIGAGEDFEQAVRGNHRLFENGVEIGGFAQSRRPRQRCPCGRTRLRSGRIGITHGFRVGSRAAFGDDPNRQADRRWRPLARRALMIARPARVDMRARNPCLRARLRRLG
jgi:hypothetical protein